MDPLTDLPYANLAAFKAIRAKLAKGEIKLPEWKLATKAGAAAAAGAAAGAAADAAPKGKGGAAAKEVAVKEEKKK